MTYIKTFSSPVGALTVKSDGAAVTEIIFGDLAGRDDLPILNEAEKQLGEYFCGTRRDFDLPIVISGTAFQVKAWAALRKIPYGETVSYKTLAEMVGNEKACRAVGMANNKNKIPIIVPCHRVINADGTLGGFSDGAAIKKILLDTERGKRDDK